VIKRISVLAFMLILTASSARAQSGDIPVADTLGANFTDTTGTAGPDAFDYLIGEWTFRFQTRNQNGAFNPPRNGEWKAWKSYDNMVVEDTWSLDPAPGQARRTTVSIRAYNPREHRWEMMGLVPGVGDFDPGRAWGSGDERHLIQVYGGGQFTVRIKYYAITADHFLWRADGSNDGGRTWQRDVWRMEATRTR
jgi:hypothetical protein